jgi:hypothetical protein
MQRRGPDWRPRKLVPVYPTVNQLTLHASPKRSEDLDGGKIVGVLVFPKPRKSWVSWFPGVLPRLFPGFAALLCAVNAGNGI